MASYYISVFEDGFVQYWSGDIPDVLLESADVGLYDVIDITDPSNPLQYVGDGEWEEMTAADQDYFEIDL